jgi:hypothetical protein
LKEFVSDEDHKISQAYPATCLFTLIEKLALSEMVPIGSGLALGIRGCIQSSSVRGAGTTLADSESPNLEPDEAPNLGISNSTKLEISKSLESWRFGD